MRIGWLADKASVLGGAELTQDEFRQAAPEGVEIVDCPPGGVVEGLDRYVVQNCVTYSVADLENIGDAHTTKFWHDVGPHVQPGVRDWLDEADVIVCCSPLQAADMGLDDATLIPPPVDVQRFAEVAARINGNRGGNVSVASWRNFGKAADMVKRWAQENGGVDFYGGGPFAPAETKGEVPYDEMPILLASFSTFVFLPAVIEPFGRVVAEAWAAGCELVINDLVGARYWIEEKPEAIETAAEDFWQLVLA